MLSQTLADVRRRIAKRPKLNENDTKATLVEPVLAALGWDVHDVEEVAREHKAPRAKPVDYALLVMREPKLYIEAKALGENLDASRVANQIMGYAAVAGVEWIVVTNGDEWRVYNSHATVPIAQKLLRSVRVSEPTADAEEILGLLSKDQLKTKQIDALWRAHFVDGKVKAALEGFFNPDKDMALVHHVRAVAKDLTPEEIRGSMRRCKLTLDFPLSPDDLPRRATAVRKRASSGSGASGITLLELVRAKVLKTPLELVGRHKNAEIRARVLKDGTVEFQGEIHASLSTAASAALASLGALTPQGKHRAVNGWDFWKYRAPNGELTPIGAARERNGGERSRSASRSAG